MLNLLKKVSMYAIVRFSNLKVLKNHKNNQFVINKKPKFRKMI